MPNRKPSSDFAARLSSCWKPDHRIKTAREIFITNAHREVTNGINEVARGAMLGSLDDRTGDQTIASSGAMRTIFRRCTTFAPSKAARLFMRDGDALSLWLSMTHRSG